MSLDILEQTCLNATQQQALYDIFSMAGYLQAEPLWEALHRIDLDETAAENIFSAVLAAKSLDELAHALPSPQAQMDLILYMAQNGFARILGQERVDLQNAPWMEAHREEYIGLIRQLGFYDSIHPHDWQIQQIWVLGTGAGVFDYYLQSLSNYGEQVDTTKLRMLGSDRLLTSSIDHTVYIDRVRVASGKDAPDERDMEMVIARQYYPSLRDIDFIYARSPEGKTRADTGDTIAEALKQIDQGTILLYGGQPFIGRQLLKAENVAHALGYDNKVQFKMAATGITPALHARYQGRDLAILHSEIGAYMTECYDAAVFADEIVDHKQTLLYMTRAALPQVPHLMIDIEPNVKQMVPCVGE